MCCADGNECESEQLQLIVLIAVSVCDMGVSAVVCTLYIELDTQKYPQSPLTEKLGCNRIKCLRSRRFGAAKLNQTSARTLDSKWQTKAQLYTREWRSKLAGKKCKLLIGLPPRDGTAIGVKTSRIPGLFWLQFVCDTPKNTPPKRWLQTDIVGCQCMSIRFLD
jgi:hypothetical protein